MASAEPGRGSDSCAASPVGVGKQNRAGLTKANNSIRSRQLAISTPLRASLQRR